VNYNQNYHLYGMGLQTVMYKAYQFAFNYVSVTSNDGMLLWVC